MTSQQSNFLNKDIIATLCGDSVSVWEIEGDSAAE